MANVSSSNGIEKYPKLRFPEFSEPWERVRIGDVYAERSERGAESAELLSVTMTEGVKRRSDIEGKDNSSEDKGNYKVVRIGDMVYNSMRMWQGANGISAYDGIVSPAYTVLTPKVEIANGFFGALFKTHRSISEFCRHSQGMTSDTWNLKYPQIETIRISMPVFKEQQKISEFLSKIEIRIEKQLDLVEHLKKYKRGVIQAVFDDEKRDLFGEISSGKQVKLSDLMDFQNGINADASKYGRGIRYISVSDILKNNFITYDKIIGQVDIDSRALATYSVTYGDVLFQRSSETREDAGRSNVYLDTEKTATFGGFVIRGKKKSDYDPLYLKYALDSFVVRKQIMQCAAGAQHINVSQEDLCNVVVNLPAIDVQNRISKFISNIDLRITTEEKKANAQATLKKALLQQLFI